MFFNDVKNGHLVYFDPSRAIFTTIALDYQTYGREIELSAEVTPDFTVFGGLGYTHAELKNIPDGHVSGARSGNDHSAAS